jgi:hypothetical protein
MTLAELTSRANLLKISQHPNLPIHALTKVKPFKDDTANELTRSIETFIRITGNYADRINNVGIYDSKINGYRKSNTRKGIADIIASKTIIIGERRISTLVAIEIKIGKDKMSEHQLKIQEEINSTGGYYIIAKDWESFITQWNQIQ